MIGGEQQRLAIARALVNHHQSSAASIANSAKPSSRLPTIPRPPNSPPASSNPPTKSSKAMPALTHRQRRKPKVRGESDALYLRQRFCVENLRFRPPLKRRH